MINRIPKTADGQIIYPGMPVYICSPYSTVKVFAATVYCVQGADGKFSDSNNYWCVLAENRYFAGDCWNDGNAEHVSVLFADRAECLQAATDKYNQFLKEHPEGRA